MTILTILAIVLALFLFAGLAIFVFKNAMRIILIFIVCAMGYVGWHIYLHDKGITPKEALSGFTEAFSSSSEKALDSVKEMTLEATEIAKKEAIKAKDKAIDSVKTKTKNAVNEVLN